MGSNNWYKIDNVAKVFLATVGKRDTRAFRVSCTLTEDIDPELLQKAVLSAIQDRPQVQVRVRRGIFWHYMEDTDIKLWSMTVSVLYFMYLRKPCCIIRLHITETG